MILSLKPAVAGDNFGQNFTFYYLRSELGADGTELYKSIQSTGI